MRALKHSHIHLGPIYSIHHTPIHKHPHPHVGAHTHTHADTHTYARTHTHTHTQTSADMHSLQLPSRSDATHVQAHTSVFNYTQPGYRFL